MAQLYSCFFLAFAVIALLVLVGFMLLASLLYLGRFSNGAVTWLWFGTLIVSIGAFFTALVNNLVVSRRRAPALPPAKQPLTEREIDMLQLIAQGLSNQEVAEKLVISERTVARQVRNIFGKLHLASRTQAALYAIRTGLSDPSMVLTAHCQLTLPSARSRSD